MEDKKIVKLLFARAENAISELSTRFGSQLHRIAYNILGNRLDAEECTNDTYLALWNAIPPVSPDPLAPYVYRTVRNTALKRLHKDTAQKRDSRYDVSLEELNGCLPGEDVEQMIDARELGRSIDRFLDTKSRENRYIFIRRYWFGDSVGEIARDLKMQENAVSVRLNRISNKHINEAEKPPKKKKVRTFLKMVVAAALVITIGTNIMNAPMRITAHAVVLASEPRMMERPDLDDYKDRDAWKADYDMWDTERNFRNETAAQAKSGLSSFFTDGNSQFLQTQGNENKLWSPVNAYIGLAMATELTEGETRSQILDLFGVEDTETLRKQVSAVWESVYQDNSNEICVLANSLWLEEGLQYNQEAMDAIAYHYYGSVYQGDLGSTKTNKDIAAWINNNTGKFLKDSAESIELSPKTIMALYSTLYFQAKWSDEFSESKNTEGVFHMQDGDTQAVYMNKKLKQMNYYWGENFSAVNLSLKNGCRMWFILPDEGMTTNDVLDNGTYMDMLLSNEWEDYKYMKVNLSVPKFDVASTMDLSEGLKNMGATNVFYENVAEFTKLTGDSPIYLTGANQSVRVQIDEEGVKAATYIEIPGAGSAAPPEEVIDFVLDRPFLFVITNGSIPLFAGCVNNPEK